MQGPTSQNLSQDFPSAISKLQPRATQIAEDTKQSQFVPLVHRFNATLIDSVDRLDDLASAIRIFKSRFDDLTSHLDYIDKSIEAIRTSKGDASQPYGSPTDQHRAELKFLCETSNGKFLRKYIIKNLLQNRDSLRAELPVAIKASPNPARLVLDCSGRFFKQGIRAYEKDHSLVQTRLAGVMALESLFLAVSNNSIEVDDKTRCEAIERALSWRSRLISEGGIPSACEADASGLLLLIFSFEISRTFSDDDLWDLLVIAMKMNLATLKRSPMLINSLKRILERIMESKVKIEAIEVIRAFGMDEKFPLEMVAEAFVENRNNKYLNQRRNESKTNPSIPKNAYANHIEVLKSAVKHLEDKKLDALKTPFEEAITKSEKDNKVKEKRKPGRNGDVRNAKRVRALGKINNNLNVGPAYCGSPENSRTGTEFWHGFEGYVCSPPRGDGVRDVSPSELYSFVDKVLAMEYGHVYNYGSSGITSLLRIWVFSVSK